MKRVKDLKERGLKSDTIRGPSESKRGAGGVVHGLDAKECARA